MNTYYSAIGFAIGVFVVGPILVIYDKPLEPNKRADGLADMMRDKIRSDNRDMCRRDVRLEYMVKREKDKAARGGREASEAEQLASEKEESEALLTCEAKLKEPI